MKILLVRPGFKNLMSGSNIVTVEPLDLEYLAAVCKEEGVMAEIYDGQITRRRFSSVIRRSRPDLVAITGYVTMVPTMLRYARAVKALDPGITVVIGGAHAELNYRDFYCDAVDLIVYSGGAGTFRQLIRLQGHGKQVRDDGTRSGGARGNAARPNTESSHPEMGMAHSNAGADHAGSEIRDREPCTGGAKEAASPGQIPGLCYRTADGEWVENASAFFDPARLLLPDRSHFYAHRQRFRYMRYRPCAVVKTSYGCPFNCNFCYCCLMNNGRYTSRPLSDVIEEIAAIDCEHFWIVDDTFLVSRERAGEFVRLLKERGLRRKFIIYSRADFVAANEDLIPLLREAGVVEIIFGLEAVHDAKLQDYNKRTSDEINRKAVRILRECGINCVGLFMVDIDATREDFANIVTWVKAAGLRQFLTSIFTPFPGTPLFERYRDRLTTRNYEKWDLLHLVVRPTHLRKWRFYYEFYKLYGIMTWMNLRSGDYGLRDLLPLPPRRAKRTPQKEEE